eukprot:7562136-Alexandrium_andersonii.AAC.1
MALPLPRGSRGILLASCKYRSRYRATAPDPLCPMLLEEPLTPPRQAARRAAMGGAVGGAG